jgi:malate dehydrogenase
MAQIGIVGSGNVGANTALFAAEKGIAHICLYDIKDGLPIGKALDLMEAAPVRGYQRKISGTNSLDEVLDSQIIMIAAGEIRTPGTKREDLFEKNRGVVEGIAARLAEFNGVVIVATEPVDVMTAHFVRVSHLTWPKVIGLGGVLDSVRLRCLIGRALNVHTRDVRATVIGRHSDGMIPLQEYCSVAGVPLNVLLSQKEIDSVFRDTMTAGDEIVGMEQHASAHYGPAAAAADLAEAVIYDTNRILSVSVMLTGQYGIHDVAMSLPAMVGEDGIERVLEPKLTDEQVALLKSSAEALAAIG